MSNSDPNNIGIKLQIAGENLNTWGDPNLNNDLKVLSNLASAWNAITINGDYTVSETLYATNNATEVATIKLVTGTVLAAFAFIMAGRPKRLLIWNATAYACTARLSATTGFVIPAGYMALVGTDGTTDVYNISPNILAGPLTVSGQVHGVAPGTASTDAVNLAQMSSAIATAGLPATAGSVLNSVNDTTAGYLSQKVAVSGLTATTQNPGANEKLLISADHKVLNSGTDTTPSFLSAKLQVGGVPGQTFNAGANETLKIPAPMGALVKSANFGKWGN